MPRTGRATITRTLTRAVTQHATHDDKRSGRASMLTRCTQQVCCVLRPGVLHIPELFELFVAWRQRKLYASGLGTTLAPHSSGTGLALDSTKKKLADASREAVSWESIWSKSRTISSSAATQRKLKTTGTSRLHPDAGSPMTVQEIGTGTTPNEFLLSYSSKYTIGSQSSFEGSKPLIN